MNLISLTLARNSAWCIEATIGHALRYCDSAVVLCHSCTDGTQDILRSMDRVDVIEVKADDKWDEMRHRQAMLDRGRELGGTHFLILDDDEAVADTLVGSMRGLGDKLAPGDLAIMPMVCCWRSLERYRSDRRFNPFAKLMKSTVFCDSAELSWQPINGYHHHHTHPFNARCLRFRTANDAKWLHFQHASWPRLVTKQTWYMAMELCRYGKVVAAYAKSMDETGLELSPVPPDWWSDLKSKIDLTARPWQVDDLKRMVDERGVEFFTDNGINVNQALDYWT